MWTREASDRLPFYASLVVHALLLFVLLRHELNIPIYLPALPGNEAGKPGLFFVIQLPTDPIKSSAVEDERNRFGEPDGKGIATSSSPGEQLMMGKEADQDQPWLSRDPEGPGPMPDEPSFSTALPGEGGSGGARGGGGGKRQIATALPDPTDSVAPLGTGPDESTRPPSPRIVLIRPAIILAPPPPRPPPPPTVEPIGITVADATTRPTDPPPPTTRPGNPVAVAAIIPPAVAVIPPSPPPSAGQSSPPSPPNQPTAPPGPAGSGRPGPRAPAADPAPMSDQESDPFARVGSVTVRAGKVDARLGRASKLIKPRITTKGQLDLISIIDPSVILKVSLDATGKVTDVDVLKSSGSNEIDLPAKLALYKSWIEPGKDKAGKPAADVIVVKFAWK